MKYTTGLAALGGLVVYGSAAAAASVYFSGPADKNKVITAPVLSSAERLKMFSDLAPYYDKLVDTDELLMGMPLFRRYILRQAPFPLTHLHAIYNPPHCSPPSPPRHFPTQ